MRPTASILRALMFGVVLILGSGCASGPTDAGAAPVVPTPSASAERATSVPVPSASELGPIPLPDDRATPPGEYVLSADALYGVPPLRLTFTVTRDGWESWGPGLVTIAAGERREVGFGFADVADVYVDPCRWDRLGAIRPRVGSTVDDLVVALQRVPHAHATKPVDATLGGVAGRYLELTIDPHQDFRTCDGGAFHIWIDSRGNSRYYQGPGQVEQFWVLDAHAVRLVVEASFFPEASSESRADLRGILDSIRIGE